MEKTGWFMLALLVGIMVHGFGTAVRAEVRTETVHYTHEGEELRGYVAYDDAVEGPRPGVMVVHQWKGLTEYERRRARQLAELGYVGFAADVYGADTRPATSHEAALASGTFREDRRLYRRRLIAGLDFMRSRKRVDEDDLAAIGYCFGGTGVLELARSGVDLDAVVSFHGGLSTPNPDQTGPVNTAVQVHHGARDPNVTQQDLISFWNEFNRTDADWDVRIYSNAVHSFTQKNAGDEPSTGQAYNRRADRLSWKAMKQLFEDTFE